MEEGESFTDFVQAAVIPHWMFRHRSPTWGMKRAKRRMLAFDLAKFWWCCLPGDQCDHFRGWSMDYN